ncbi:hypothetical protein C2845_PM06G31470 [Panicum miliaceum]|uniref:Zinc finger GRF-type domain-containing protein n=1 Tax=Panicum miliaceum TaxID=4540 RepID=A0A3L6RAT4_PANMI|nr:hypothetical protein C2845_PM06G31470 [Panicum miliaceum]
MAPSPRGVIGCLQLLARPVPSNQALGSQAKAKVPPEHTVQTRLQRNAQGAFGCWAWPAWLSFVGWAAQAFVTRARNGGFYLGGVVNESLVLCRHGLHPCRLFTWEGKHTGRRYLGCNLEDKSKRCDFALWVDEKCPARAQQAILTLWDMVGQSMEKANCNMVDKMAEQALKNEVKEQKEALEAEKEVWEIEKHELIMEKDQLRARWRFSQSCCSALQSIVKNELEEKKRVWIVVVCLIGTLVAMLFGVVLKMK